MLNKSRNKDQSISSVIGDLFDWLEALLILKHDLHLEKDNLGMRRIIFLDYSEIRGYCLPSSRERVFDPKKPGKKITDKELFGEFFALLYILNNDGFIKILLPPYLLEMKGNLTSIENQITELMIKSEKRRNTIVESILKILPDKRDWEELSTPTQSVESKLTPEESSIIFNFLNSIFPQLAEVLKIDWRRGLTLLIQLLEEGDIQYLDTAFPDFTIDNRLFSNRVPDYLKYFNDERKAPEQASANRYDAYAIECIAQILEKYKDLYCLFATRSYLMIDTLERTLPLYEEGEGNPKGTKSIGRNLLYFLARIIFIPKYGISEINNAYKKVDTAILKLSNILKPITSRREVIRDIVNLGDIEKNNILSHYNDLLSNFSQLKNEEDRLKTTLNLKRDMKKHLKYFETSLSRSSSYSQIAHLLPVFFDNNFQKRIDLLKRETDKKFKSSQRRINTLTRLANKNVDQIRYIVAIEYDVESILQSDLKGTSGELPYNIRFLNEKVRSFSKSVFVDKQSIDIPKFIDDISQLESLPDSPTEFKLLLGYIYIKLDKIDWAVEVIEEGLDECRDKGEQCFEYHFLISIAKRINKNYKEAYRECNKAIELEKQYLKDLNFADARYLRELGQITWYCNLWAEGGENKIPVGIGNKYDAVDLWIDSLGAFDNDGIEVRESPIKVFLYNSLAYAHIIFSREKADGANLVKAKTYLDKFSVEFSTYFHKEFIDTESLLSALPIRFKDTAATYYAQKYNLDQDDVDSLKTSLKLFDEITLNIESHLFSKWYKNEILENNNKLRALAKKRGHSDDLFA